MKNYNQLWILLAMCSWYGCPSATLDGRQKTPLAHKDAWVVRTYLEPTQVQAGQTFVVQCMVSNKGHVVNTKTQVDAAGDLLVVEQQNDKTIFIAEKTGSYQLRCFMDDPHVEDPQGVSVEVIPGEVATLRLVISPTTAAVAGQSLPYECQQLDAYDNQLLELRTDAHVCATPDVQNFVSTANTQLQITRAGSHALTCCFGQDCCSQSAEQIVSDPVSLPIDAAHAARMAANLPHGQFYPVSQAIGDTAAASLYQFFDAYDNLCPSAGIRTATPPVALFDTTKQATSQWRSSNQSAFCVDQTGYYVLRQDNLPGDFYGNQNAIPAEQRTILVCVDNNQGVSGESHSIHVPNALSLRVKREPLFQRIFAEKEVPFTEGLEGPQPFASWEKDTVFPHDTKLFLKKSNSMNFTPELIAVGRSPQGHANACETIISLPQSEKFNAQYKMYENMNTADEKEVSSQWVRKIQLSPFEDFFINPQDITFDLEQLGSLLVAKNTSVQQRDGVDRRWFYERPARFSNDPSFATATNARLTELANKYINSSLKDFFGQHAQDIFQTNYAKMGSDIGDLQCSQDPNNTYLDINFAMQIDHVDLAAQDKSRLFAACRPGRSNNQAPVNPELTALSEGEDFSLVMQDNLTRQLLWNLWTHQQFNHPEDMSIAEGVTVTLEALLPPELLPTEHADHVSIVLGDVKLVVKAHNKEYNLYAAGVFDSRISLTDDQQPAWELAQTTTGIHAWRIENTHTTALFERDCGVNLRQQIEFAMREHLSQTVQAALQELPLHNLTSAKFFPNTRPKLTSISRPANASYTIVKGQFEPMTQ